MEVLHITTSQREEMIPLSSKVEKVIREKGFTTGAILIFCPHTTASITINESGDPDVRSDMTHFMHHLVPKNFGFEHAEDNSDAHIKTSLFTPHSLLIVEEGRLMRGTWQEIYFCEWDGPRKRDIWIQFLSS